MRPSELPTNHIAIKASTETEANCTILLQAVSNEWKELMNSRLNKLGAFKSDVSFLHLSYWDTLVGYCNSTIQLVPSALFDNGKSWTYVYISSEELDCLEDEDFALTEHTIKINFDGGAHYTAYDRHSNIEHFSDVFQLSELVI